VRRDRWVVSVGARASAEHGSERPHLVTCRASLGFHAVRSIDRRGRMYAEPEATEVVLEVYPAQVRSWIRRCGGLTSRLLQLRRRELTAVYPFGR